MAATSIRWPAAKRLFSLLNAQPLLADVPCTTAYPGVDMADENVWLDTIGSVDGDSDAVEMAGGLIVRDDQFTLTLIVRVAGQQVTDGQGSTDDAWERLVAIVAPIEQTLVDHATLDDLDGCSWALVTRIREQCADLKEGPVAMAEVTVTVQTHLAD